MSRFGTKVKIMSAGATQILVRLQGGKILRTGWVFRARQWLSRKVAPPVPMGTWLDIQLTNDGKLQVDVDKSAQPDSFVAYDDMVAGKTYGEYPLSDHLKDS